MKWSPEELHPGDIIRVKIGSVYHYGIFCSEEEVVAFGYPPLRIREIRDEEVRVVSTDIETFSAGNFVERGIMDAGENRRANPPGERMRRAKARIGEGGYSLLHNNCEHFVNECAFGERRSSQEDEARARWNRRPLFAVFVAPLPENLPTEKLYPRERNREILLSGNKEVRKQRYAVWKLLETGVSRCFGYDFSDLHFHKSRDGKWTADEFYFSLSHTESAVAAVLSNAPCGIDIEDKNRRKEYYGKYPEKLPKLLRRVLTEKEEREKPGESYTTEDFVRIWTKKECLFKAYDGKRFNPERIETGEYRTKTFALRALPALLVSVCGDQMDQFTVFLSENGSLTKLSEQETEEFS